MGESGQPILVQKFGGSTLAERAANAGNAEMLLRYVGRIEGDRCWTCCARCGACWTECPD